MWIIIGDENTVYSLLFDNVPIILAKDEDDAASGLGNLVEELNSWGLQTNVGKRYVAYIERK